MEDSISRQAAIDAILEDKIDSKSLEIMRVLGDSMQAQTFNDACDRHAQIIKTLPSAQPDIARDIATILENEQDMRVIAQNAQPERKTGKWVKMSDRDGIYWACSECGEDLPRVSHFDPQFDLFPRLESIDKTNFCPNCGARMEEQE